MATFRNSQIEEILNDERRLNRTIMDRQKQHVSAIGDQRAPPLVRDIKLEAIFGSEIDELKEEINKVIQLVSAFQFGKLDDKKIDRLLKLDTNEQKYLNTELYKKDQTQANKPPSEGKESEEGNEKGDNDGEDDNVAIDPNYASPFEQPQPNAGEISK
jgi:CO dehydrogenase/acetyl-CoA synthase delta subunit